MTYSSEVVDLTLAIIFLEKFTEGQTHNWQVEYHAECTTISD